MDAHVHLGVTLHRADEAFVGLLARLVDQLLGKESAKQQGEANWNAIALVKSAPLRKIERANATDA
jgi:hypothetical protein